MDKNEGFTKLYNSLFDAIIAQKLTASQLKALLYIIRQTEGFGVPERPVSVSKMAKQTGFTRRSMINAVHDLEKMGIIRLGKFQHGKMTKMSVLSPDFWDKPVNCTSHVNRNAHVNSGSIQPVNCTSHPPVNCTSQVPVNCASHNTDNITYIITEKIIQRDSPSSGGDEDEGEDAMVLYARLKRKRANEEARSG